MQPPGDLVQLRWLGAILVLGAMLAWETIRPYFPFFSGRGRSRTVHAFRNMLFGVVNAALIALIFAALWAWSSVFSAERGWGLLHHLELATLPRLLVAILLLDFWTYWWHWLNHRVPLFWRFHRMHHSDPEMDVTSANRFHTGEIVLSSILRIPLILLIGIQMGELVVYETLLFAVVQFHHANIGLPSCLDRAMRVIIPTPDMHKVHHSRIVRETNSNYSSLFSIWDRAFGTFRLRNDPRGIQFGLDEFDSPEAQELAGLVKTPLRRIPTSTGRKRFVQPPTSG